jgi:hypothetical protein
MADRKVQFRGGVYEAPAGQDLYKMQEEFYALHPEARVTPGENVLYGQQDREQMNALYGTPSPTENLFNTLMPANVRAAYGTYIGDQEPISQHYFSAEDLAAMRDHYLQQQAAYAQHPIDPGMSYAELSQLRHSVPPVQSLPGIGNVLQSYADQNYRIAPFTQGAYYEHSPEGTYMVNEYRAGQHQRPVRVLLPQ